jgi:hypothetical protein
MKVMKKLPELLGERILFLDGAMGTMIQRYKLAEADYRGERFAHWASDLKGNNDLLTLTRPHVIREIHDAYLAAGADIIETNTFNATRVAMADYHMEELAFEINVAAARLAVGFIGFISGSAAYLYALNYARERLQGRDLESVMDADAPQVPIIRHPDVRRMLLWMKAHVEGMRSFIYLISSLIDRQTCSDDDEQREFSQGLIDLLTPVIKSYCSERGFEICVEAIQVYGGYGYIKEYPMEQLLRDCRITQIYEGTNGIQAMDLLARKLGMNQGKPVMDLLGEIQQTLAAAKKISNLTDTAAKTEAAVNKLGEVMLHIGQAAMSIDTRMNAFSHAYPFMEVSGDVVFAWLLLWRATLAARNLENGAKKKDLAFYEGQIKSAEFFANSILPVSLGKMKAILAGDNSVVDISADAFGGK